MPYVTVDVDVDLDNFETQDLIDELESRNEEMPNHVDSADIVNLVNEIYLARHVRKQNYDQLIDQLIYSMTGKVV